MAPVMDYDTANALGKSTQAPWLIPRNVLEAEIPRSFLKFSNILEGKGISGSF